MAYDMSKYKFKPRGTSPSNYDIFEIQTNIANELAEANRLKRIELRHKDVLINEGELEDHA